ncbi:MAG: tetratricopeptide repeat protein [Lentisphaerae bacterium]|nr:tetratricopeptide repeat protein [Lentisphaerota bacterium]
MRRHWPIITILILAVTAIYGQILGHDFVWIDDRPYITNNPMVMRGLHGEGILWAFTSMAQANWHPLTWISHMLDVTLWGSWAGGHHLGNVVLHALNSMLVFLVFRFLTAGAADGENGPGGQHQDDPGGTRRFAVAFADQASEAHAAPRDVRTLSLEPPTPIPDSPWTAFFVAALFAVHPMHVESVAWAAERKDVLCAFFFLLALGAYGRFVRDRYEAGQSGLALGGSRQAAHRPDVAAPSDCPAPRTHNRWYLLTLLSFTLALLAKPMAVTLPLVLLLLDWWPLNRFRICGQSPLTTFREASRCRSGAQATVRRSYAAVLVEKLPFFALSAVSCVVTALAQRGAMAPIEHIGVVHRLANALVSYGAYLRKLFWPIGLCFDYPYRAQIWFWHLLLSVALLATWTVLAVRVRQRHPYVLFGWLWYGGMMVPVIGLVQVGHAAMADRYAYLPFLGLYVAFVWGVRHVLRTPFRRRLGAVAAAGVLSVYGSVAHHQAAFWRNTITLYERTLNLTGPSEMALVALGGVLGEHNRLDEALARLQEALRIGPNIAETETYLALTLSKMQRFEEATQHARASLKLKSDYVSAYGALGEALFQLGRADEAVAAYEEGLAKAPGTTYLLYNIGKVAEAAGRFDQAVAAYRKALAQDPRNWLQRVVLADALIKAGRLNDGRAELDRAVADRPITGQSRTIMANAYSSLAEAFESENSTNGAWAALQAAMAIDPGALEPRRDWLLLLSRRGDERAASVANDLYKDLKHKDFSVVEVGNDVAWILSTHPKASMRNKEQAVELAEGVAGQSRYRDPTVLDTLAAAYAASGQFTIATNIAARALHLATAHGDSVLAQAVHDRLEGYMAGRSYYDISLVGESP